MRVHQAHICGTMSSVMRSNFQITRSSTKLQIPPYPVKNHGLIHALKFALVEP